MEGSKRLLGLSLGLCLVSYYVNALQVYGGGLFDFNADVTEKLETLKRHQREIENSLQRPRLSIFEKWLYEAELQGVLKNIAEIEQTSRVSYKDYLDMKAEQQGHFEKEIKNLQSKLDYAKKKEINEEVRRYQTKIDELANERDRIKKMYNEHVHSNILLEHKMKEEKEQLEKEKKEVMEVLKTAKQRHSRALAILSASPNDGYRVVCVPEKDTINKIKHDILLSMSMKDKNQQINGLRLAKTKLEALLPALHEKSKFYHGTDRQDMEDALGEMEINTAYLREEQTNRRKEILEQMKNKGLTEYTDDEIALLEKINEQLAATDTFETEIATRSANLKALMEASDLIEECLAAVRDAESGDLIKFWADAFEGAKNQFQKLENQFRSAFQL